MSTKPTSLTLCSSVGDLLLQAPPMRQSIFHLVGIQSQRVTYYVHETRVGSKKENARIHKGHHLGCMTRP